jgi:hypothetical protein
VNTHHGDLEAAADQILAARMDESETASKPAASKPAASKPAASKPAAPKPAASKPAARKPGQAAEQDEAVVLICEPSQHGGTGHANTALGSAYNTQAKTQLECEQGAAREAHSAAANTLEAWLKRQPEQKVLLVGMGQFYDQYAAAGQIVKHRGIRPFAADHGALFLVSGKGPAMAIRATSTHRAGDEERRRDQDGELYTKVEFIGEYGGVLEWEQAERELRVDGQTQASRPQGGKSKGGKSKPPPRAITLEDADGQEITLAARIEEEEDDDDEELLGSLGRLDLSRGSPDSDEYVVPGTSLELALVSFFAPQPLAACRVAPRTSLYVGENAFEQAPSGVELGLLGHLQSAKQDQVFINVTDPFCLITVGVQGSGKSHTTACILESCLLPFPPVVNAHQPMAVLVCHYDQSEVNCCEATGLSNPSAKVAFLLSAYGDTMIPPSLSDSQILVLCSPSFYHQRSKYYAGVCEVRPLLFKWKSLKAQQLKKLMKLDESSTQLYVALMLDMLRDFQRQEKVPAYEDFIQQVQDLATVPGQSGPLKQRFQMLSSFVYESDKNESLRDVGVDLADVMEAGRMVVVDLTDPMMSPADANGVFQVLLETFRFKQIPRAGKLVAFDEAHRYMGMHGESDALAQEITNCARLMRHEGMRLVISTQSPKVMPEELLELTTVLISHRFQSNDWHTYLAKKVPLPEGSFETIRSLAPGEALVYSARPCLTAQDEMGRGAEVIRVQVRKRLTADRGASRVNRKMLNKQFVPARDASGASAGVPLPLPHTLVAAGAASAPRSHFDSAKEEEEEEQIAAVTAASSLMH